MGKTHITFFVIFKAKKERQTAPSHKEVCTCFVGTGVLDCPLAQKFDPQKTNN